MMLRQNRSKLTFVVSGLCLFCGRASATDRYVDHNAGGGVQNGTSWSNAYLTLQDALAIAGSGDIIRVAQGTYYPDEGAGQTNDAETSAFFLIDGVQILGGFFGIGESETDQRNIDGYRTFLDGNIDNNGQLEGNAYNVVRSNNVTGTAVIQGFTIQNGYADLQEFPNDVGGGMFNIAGSPTVDRCLFFANRSSEDNGGGMFNHQASPFVVDCVFQANIADLSGGAVFNNDGSNGTFIRCDFISNTADVDGGGEFNGSSSTPTFFSCGFVSNLARSRGGGVYNTTGSNTTFLDCFFRGNLAIGPGSNRGGAIFNNDSNLTIRSSYFIGNEAEAGGAVSNVGTSVAKVTNSQFEFNLANFGGAVEDSTGGSSTIVNTEFRYNTAVGDGGAVMTVNGGHTDLVNCSFYGNVAEGGNVPPFPFGGGGIAVEISSDATITNCTFGGNTSTGEGVDDGGGAVIVLGESSVVMANVILWGNESANPSLSLLLHAQLLVDASSSATVNHSIVQDWTVSLPEVDGMDVLDTDPFFLDIPGDFRVQEFSPAIDSGDNDVLLLDPNDVDNDGEFDETIPFTITGILPISEGLPELGHVPRILDTTVDRGVREFFVDCNDNKLLDLCDVDCNPVCLEILANFDHKCGFALDCQDNGIPDSCDIDPSDPDGDGEVSSDCNQNGIPDGVCVELNPLPCVGTSGSRIAGGGVLERRRHLAGRHPSCFGRQRRHRFAGRRGGDRKSRYRRRHRLGAAPTWRWRA